MSFPLACIPHLAHQVARITTTRRPIAAAPFAYRTPVSGQLMFADLERVAHAAGVPLSVVVAACDGARLSDANNGGGVEP